jgi:hypothetical protein
MNFCSFFRPKDIKKVLMEGNGRENKKRGPTLLLSPTKQRCIIFFFEVAQTAFHTIPSK